MISLFFCTSEWSLGQAFLVIKWNSNIIPFVFALVPSFGCIEVDWSSSLVTYLNILNLYDFLFFLKKTCFYSYVHGKHYDVRSIPLCNLLFYFTAFSCVEYSTVFCHVAWQQIHFIYLQMCILFSLETSCLS